MNPRACTYHCHPLVALLIKNNKNKIMTKRKWKTEMWEELEWNPESVVLQFDDHKEAKIYLSVITKTCHQLAKSLLLVPEQNKTEKKLKLPFKSHLWPYFRSILCCGAVSGKLLFLDEQEKWEFWCDLSAMCDFCDCPTGQRVVLKEIEAVMSANGDFKMWLQFLGFVFEFRNKYPNVWHLVEENAITQFRMDLTEGKIRNFSCPTELRCFDSLREDELPRVTEEHSGAYTCCKHSFTEAQRSSRKTGLRVIRSTLVALLRPLTDQEEQLDEESKEVLQIDLSAPLCWSRCFPRKVLSTHPSPWITRFCCEHATPEDEEFRKEIARANQEKQNRYNLYTSLPAELFDHLLKSAVFGFHKTL
jgi:hypothetical protein